MKPLVFGSGLLAVLAATTVLAQTAPAAPAAAFTLVPAEAVGGAYTLDKRHASVTAKISHFGFSNYTLMFRGLDATLDYNKANPANSRIAFVVDPKSIDTGLPAFDEELVGADWLGTAPVRFVSTGLTATGPRTGKLAGNLTLKGVTKPVTFDVTFNGGGPDMRGKPTLGFSAEGVIDRTEFGVNQYAGPVGKDVRLMIEAEFNKP